MEQLEKVRAALRVTLARHAEDPIDPQVVAEMLR
jgi:hypothetical protein